MRLWNLIAAAAMAGLMSACTTTPDVTVHYFLPKAETRLQVLQSIDCDAGKENLLIATTVTPATTYLANRDRPQAFAFKGVDGIFANADLSFTLTDDGRLKSVNATETGKGEDILKAATTLAVSLGGLNLFDEEIKLPVGGSKTAECDFIAAVGNNKPISLSYSATLDYSDVEFSSALPIKPDQGSIVYFKHLEAKLPKLSVSLQNRTKIAPAATANPKADASTATLTLTGLQAVELHVSAATDQGGAEIWQDRAIIPDKDATIGLPVPRAEPFGNRTFALTLADSGAITQLRYAKDAGATGVLNALNAGAVALKPDTDADKAAAIKAQADLIAQQQRLLACQTKPVDCK
jgi:hypothetical protein